MITELDFGSSHTEDKPNIKKKLKKDSGSEAWVAFLMSFVLYCDKKSFFLLSDSMLFYYRLCLMVMILLTLLSGGWMLHQKYAILILERLVLAEEKKEHHLNQTFQNKEAEWSLLTSANRLHTLCHKFLTLQSLQPHQKQSIASFQALSTQWIQALSRQSMKPSQIEVPVAPSSHHGLSAHASQAVPRKIAHPEIKLHAPSSATVKPSILPVFPSPSPSIRALLAQKKDSSLGSISIHESTTYA